MSDSNPENNSAVFSPIFNKVVSKLTVTPKEDQVIEEKPV